MQRADWITVRSSGPTDSRTHWVVNVLIVLVVLLAPLSVAYAISQPEERYTEFSVLTRDESGTLVSSDYPEDLEVGDATPLVLSIANHERSSSTYTVVVQLQRVHLQGERRGAVETSETLTSERLAVAPGQTRHVDYELTPTFAGEDLRVFFLLYRGDPPANPTARNAYRALHLWVNVSSGGT